MKRAALGSFLLVAAVALLVPLAPPATAHTELVLSTPGDGDALTAAPAEVVLTFSEELIPETVKVSITDDSGVLVPADPARVDASDVTVTWPAGLAGGRYSVNYRVVSQDGHPVSGSIAFSVDGAAATPSTSASATPVASAAAEATSTDAPSSTDSPGRTIVLIAAGLAAGIGIGIVATVRRRGGSS